MKIWVLFDENNEVVVPGTLLKTFRGEEVILKSGTPPKHEGSTGRIYVDNFINGWSQEVFPSVCNLKWVRV